MDIMTENYKIISVRVRENKGIATKTHSNMSGAQLVVVNMDDLTEVDRIATFDTLDQAKKAKESIRKANEENEIPWDVNEFKKNLE